LELSASTGGTFPGRTVAYGIDITRVGVPMSQPLGLRIKDPSVIPLVPGSDTFTPERFSQMNMNKSFVELDFTVSPAAEAPKTYTFEVEASALPPSIQHRPLTLMLKVIQPRP